MPQILRQRLVVSVLVTPILALTACIGKSPTPTPTAARASRTPKPEPSKTPSITPTEEVVAGVEVAEPVGVIFYNGAVLTMELEDPQVEAIAIRGNRIQAVGSDEEILALAGMETQVINLAGHTLMPGFADGHTHILAFPGRMGKTLDDAQEVALRFGFTSVSEMWADDAFLGELMQAEQDGRLRLRVNVFPIYNDGILDDNGNKVVVKTWFPGNDPVLDPERMLRIPGIKIFVDGAGTPGRGCPAMSQPYPEETRAQDWFQEICGSDRGDLYWSQEELNQVVAEAQAAGYRVAMHAMGDWAIETAIDAVVFALDGQSNATVRHQIQHSSTLRPDLLQRYPTMDMLSSVRGYFNTCDQDTYNTHWASNRYALPGLGVHAYLETDFGWTADPDDMYALRIPHSFMHLYGLVTHQQIRSDDTVCEPAPWIAQHVITVQQALRMMTYEPAFAVSQEAVLGTLEAGKFADLIILSENPLAIDPDDLKDLEVWMTMVGGNVEYCASGREGFCPDQQILTSSSADAGADAPPQAVSPTPTIEASKSAIEPVTIKIFLEQEQVPVGTPIQVTIGWTCNTAEQTEAFLDSMTLAGQLDGQTLLDMNEYWSDIEAIEGVYGDPYGDYQVIWLYPLGVLPPGEHVVEVSGTLRQPITDGFDSNEDGRPDEYSGALWAFTLRIDVEG